jgi:hypothetical protein
VNKITFNRQKLDTLPEAHSAICVSPPEQSDTLQRLVGAYSSVRLGCKSSQICRLLRLSESVGMRTHLNQSCVETVAQSWRLL